jgi:hypothetical protein
MAEDRVSINKDLEENLANLESDDHEYVFIGTKKSASVFEKGIPPAKSALDGRPKVV